jgi:UDP-N-acetylglucosamine 2-epimerase (non-hydrolysing)
MLRQVTDYFGIHPDFDLKLMAPGQSLAQLTARLIVALDESIGAVQPDCVVAQGDTTSVLAASLAAFYRRVPFVHVKAGLRTGDLTAPWPEEFNRRVASVSTALHCAPTRGAADNLRREGVPPHQILVTGNTVIDALLTTIERERAKGAEWQEKYAWLDNRDLVLVTVHRRENHGEPLDGICTAIAELAAEFATTAFILPVHLNPQVQEVVRRRLAGIDNLRLTPPLAYPEFVWLMDRDELLRAAGAEGLGRLKLPGDREALDKALAGERRSSIRRARSGRSMPSGTSGRSRSTRASVASRFSGVK